MTRTERYVVIRRPIEEVFGWFVDIPYGVRLAPGMKPVRRISPDPIDVGSKLEGIMPPTLLNLSPWADLEVTEYEPNRVFAYESLPKAFPYAWRYEFEKVERGTLVIATFEEEEQGRLRRLGRRYAHWELFGTSAADSLDKLKRRLEGAET